MRHHKAAHHVVGLSSQMIPKVLDVHVPTRTTPPSCCSRGQPQCVLDLDISCPPVDPLVLGFVLDLGWHLDKQLEVQQGKLPGARQNFAPGQSHALGSSIVGSASSVLALSEGSVVVDIKEMLNFRQIPGQTCPTAVTYSCW